MFNVFKLDITASDDDIFELPKMVKIKGKKNSTARPLIERVAANLANMCALSAQEAMVDKIGKEFNIRVKSNKGRMPSFVQT